MNLVSRFTGDLSATGTKDSPLPSDRYWVNSPYSWTITRLARKVGTLRSIVLGMTIHAVVPFVIFLIWYLSGERGPAQDGSCPSLAPARDSLDWMLPLASTWIVLGPVLMFVGEIGYGRALRQIERTQKDGWNMAAIGRQASSSARLRLPVIVIVTAAIVGVYVAGNQWFRACLGMSGPGDPITFWTGMVILAQMGVSIGLGLWGVYKAIGFIFAATKFPFDDRTVRLPPWSPFRPDQIPGIETLANFNLSTAFIFSSGSVMAPAITMIAVRGDFGIFTFIVLWTSVVALLLGSSVLFLAPTIRLRTIASRQRHDYLTALGKDIEKSLRAGPVGPRSDGLDLHLMIDMYGLASGQTALPKSLTIVSRIPASIMLPTLSLIGTYVGLWTT